MCSVHRFGTPPLTRVLLYLLVGLVPRYPVCRLFPAFVKRIFRTWSTAVVHWYRGRAPPGGDATGTTKQNKAKRNRTEHN